MDRLFPDYMVEFFEHLSKIGRESSTLKRYSSDLAKFVDWFEKYKGAAGKKEFLSLSQNDLKLYVGYLEQKKYSDATVRRLISVLIQLLSFHKVEALHFLKSASQSRPLRALSAKDFITDDEYKKLLGSIRSTSGPGEVTARDYLIDRNTAIVKLMRSHGLSPIEISSITMNDINLFHSVLTVEGIEYTLSEDILKPLRAYLNTIDKKLRPRIRTEDPLFVAFNNLSLSFQFDYEISRPKYLSPRAIQEFIKDEVRMAEIRKLSAVNLRNCCILDYVIAGHSDSAIMSYFRLSSAYSLKRYKMYAESLTSAQDGAEGLES